MDYVLADYTWARAVLLLGPTVATLGMAVQVPLATAADAVLGHPHFMDSWNAVALTSVGSLLILGGVGGINLDPWRSSGGGGGGAADGADGADDDADSRLPLLQALEEP